MKARKIDEVEEGARVFGERGRIERLSRIRQLVFGSLDGLLVPLGVVSGVAGGMGDSRAVIVVASELGINTLAPETVRLPEALTMGAAYVVGSIFPLAACFFFPVPVALPMSAYQEL